MAANNPLVDAAVLQLLRYQATFSPDYSSVLRQGLELEKMYTPKAFSSKGTYTAKSLSASEMLQSNRPRLNAKGGTSVTGVTMSQREGAINIPFTYEDMQEWAREFAIESDFRKDNDRPDDWMFPKFLMEEVLNPKLIEELNIASFQGSYLAPVDDNTPNASINVFDGILTRITAAASANKISPTVTANWTTANVLSELTKFVRALPILYRNRGGVIYCSQVLFEWAKDRYIADYGTNQVVNDYLGFNEAMRLPNQTNIYLVPLVGMGITSRIIFEPKGKQVMMWGSDPAAFGGIYPSVRWVLDDVNDTVWARMRMSRGYELTYYAETFVNDKSANITIV